MCTFSCMCVCMRIRSSAGIPYQEIAMTNVFILPRRHSTQCEAGERTHTNRQQQHYLTATKSGIMQFPQVVNVTCCMFK